MHRQEDREDLQSKSQGLERHLTFEMGFFNTPDYINTTLYKDSLLRPTATLYT